MTNIPKRPRVQLDFSSKSYEELKELVEKSKHETIPNMLRDAIRIYRWYITRKVEGYSIFLEKDGERIKVDLGL